MNDVIRLAAEQAAKNFERCGTQFTGAGFSTALCRIAGTGEAIDGLVVRALLTGRPDIQPMGCGMYTILRSGDKA